MLAVLWFAILPDSGTGIVGLLVGIVPGAAALAGARPVPPNRTSPLVVDRPPEEVLAPV